MSRATVATALEDIFSGDLIEIDFATGMARRARPVDWGEARWTAPDLAVSVAAATANLRGALAFGDATASQIGQQELDS